MNTIKVAAVQMDLVQCCDENDFLKLIDTLTKKSVASGAEIVCFPEDLSFCLAWASESYRVTQIRSNNDNSFQPFKIKNLLETFIDLIISKIKLNSMGEWLSQKRISKIYHRVFSEVSKANNVVIVCGSLYERKIDGIYNVSYVYENGNYCGEFKKYKLVPIEKSWGVKAGNSAKPISTSKCEIGVCICYDLDDPNFIKELTDNGSQFIVAPSGGWRPIPNYPFDREKETPQIKRAVENNISIVRPYCCGWLAPALYFQGHTMIVGPDGKILEESLEWGREKIFCVDLPLKPKKIKI